MEAVIKGIPILAVIQGLSKFHGKKYCYPSQLKLLELMKNRVGIRISLATLNRYLRVIDDQGWIRRIRRIKRDPVKGIVFQSTIYIITKTGYRLIAKLGVKVWFYAKSKVKKPAPKIDAPGVIKYNGDRKKFIYKRFQEKVKTPA